MIHITNKLLQNAMKHCIDYHVVKLKMIYLLMLKLQKPYDVKTKLHSTYWHIRHVPGINKVVFFVQFNWFKWIRVLALIFCYQNCSDLLCEKNVLVIEKNFWNSRLKAENLQKLWDHLNNLFKQWKVRTIFGNKMLF